VNDQWEFTGLGISKEANSWAFYFIYRLYPGYICLYLEVRVGIGRFFLLVTLSVIPHLQSIIWTEVAFNKKNASSTTIGRSIEVLFY
jgi:hypothetical protein